MKRIDYNELIPSCIILFLRNKNILIGAMTITTYPIHIYIYLHEKLPPDYLAHLSHMLTEIK